MIRTSHGTLALDFATFAALDRYAVVGYVRGQHVSPFVKP